MVDFTKGGIFRKYYFTKEVKQMDDILKRIEFYLIWKNQPGLPVWA